MIPYTMRFDDTQYQKMRVIAAIHGDSFLKYLQKMIDREIAEYEKRYGEIELLKY